MRTSRVAIVFGVIVFAASLGAVKALSASRTATVVVTEKEMTISLSKAQVPAGKVTFVVRNKGTVEHELVVVRWQRNVRQLPMSGFKADEGDLGVGEVEDVEPSGQKNLTLTLDRGRYALICNIVGHYQLGMARVLVVR